MTEREKSSSGETDQGQGAAKDTDTGNKRSLSQLLDEYDKGSRADSQDTKDAPKGKDDVASIKDELAAFRAERDERDYDSLLTSVRGELSVGNEIVDGWLRSKAKDEPNIVKAFDARTESPGKFKELVKTLGSEFEKYAQEQGLSGKEKAGKDKSGLVAAVRSARESDSGGNELDDTDWGSLSDSELAAKKSEVFRLAAAGKLQ